MQQYKNYGNCKTFKLVIVGNQDFAGTISAFKSRDLNVGLEYGCTALNF